MNFYETKMGHIFFEHQVPHLINALNTLTTLLTKPVPAVALPVSVDPKFLRDLFFGDYEPEIYKVSPELRKLNRTVAQDYKSLTATLPEDSIKQLEEYKAAVSARNIAVTEQAYKAGVHAAVQMILAGLSQPEVRHGE
jgi:hypothetical protein